jgi:hypothetical protein
MDKGYYVGRDETPGQGQVRHPLYTQENLDTLVKNGFDNSAPQIVKLPKGRAALLRYRADNCDRLIELLKTQDEVRHAQHDWGTVGPCGTRACALGIAAIYNIVPGLQYTFCLYQATTYFDDGSGWDRSTYPLVNGERVSWESAAVTFFGRDAFDKVFGNGDLEMPDVLKRLARIAYDYRHKAGVIERRVQRTSIQRA